MPKRNGRRHGTLIIIGGHEDHEDDRVILKEIASRLRGKRVVVATIASHEPEGYFENYERSFRDLGVKDVVELYVQDRIEALQPDKLALLDDVAGVFFSGGDQLRITSQIGDTPIYSRVKEIFAEGGLIAGTSAGASAMGEAMLISGPGSISSRIGDLHIGSGLGLLPDVIIDQHFAERGRIGRLIGSVAQNPRMLGIGIDENTAIVVEKDEFCVVGAGAVYVVDGTAVSSSNVAEAEPDQTLSIFDLKLHVMGAGTCFTLSERKPSAPAPAASSRASLSRGE